MAKKNQKTAMVRNTILGIVGSIVILIAGFALYVSLDLGQGEITAGQDYRIVEKPRPQRPGNPVQVLEFFSYACIHCKNFDPVIEEWAAAQGDEIEFRRVPVTFSPVYALLSQAYLTFEAAGVLEKNHTRLFRAIHDRGRQFMNPEDVAAYVDGHGISAEQFLREFESPEVREAMRRANRDQLDFKISATPQLVVAGRYVVGMDGGQRRALDVVEHLLAKEQAPATPPATN